MRSGRLVLLVATIGFGSLPILAQLALREGAEPFTFLTGRFVFASALLLVVLVGTRNVDTVQWRDIGVAFALGALVYAGQAVALTFALTEADASMVAAMFAVYPAIVLLGAAAVSGWEQVHRVHLVALLGVLVGVAMALAPRGASGMEVGGAVLALVSAACFASFVLAAHRFAPTVEPLVLSTFACVGGAVSAALVGAATGDLHLPPNATAWLAIMGAGVLGTGVAFVALFSTASRTGPVTAGIILGAEPAVTVLLATAVLGDRMTPWQYVGVMVIVGSVAVLGAAASRSSGSVL